MARRSYGQYCGLTTAAELVGERWALLIIRDLLVGPRRYTDLKTGLPRIPTNILSRRLKELQEAGVIGRAMVPGGVAYELTEYGRALEPALLALGRWGFQAMAAPAPDDIVTPDSLTMALRTSFRPEQAPDADLELHVGDIALRVLVRDGALRVWRISPQASPGGAEAPGGEPEAIVVAGPGIRRLIAGEVTPAEALAQDLLAVVRGDPAVLAAFAAAFHIAPLVTSEPQRSTS